MRLIGITGKAASGKSSIANWLMEHRDAFVDSFAWPIKRGLVEMFAPLGLTMTHFIDPALKEAEIPAIGRSPRYLAQTLGTEWAREHLGGDVWIRRCEANLRDAHVWGAGSRLIVVPDVRFENEADWIRKHGTLLHVRRPGANGMVGVIGHASEGGIVPHAEDFLIQNVGTLADLYAQVATIFQPAMAPELMDE